MPAGGINAYPTLLAPFARFPPHPLAIRNVLRRAESRWGAAGTVHGMLSYVAGKVDGTTLTRGARNQVNRFPGNVQARDTRAPTGAYEGRKERTREKEKRSFEHIGTDVNNIARPDKKSSESERGSDL